MLAALFFASAAHADVSPPVPAAPVPSRGPADPGKCPDIRTFPRASAYAEAGRRTIATPREMTATSVIGRHLLFASRPWARGAAGSVVVNLADGREEMRLGLRASGLAADSRGHLFGAIAVDAASSTVTWIPTAGSRWSTTLDRAAGRLEGDGAAAVIDGDRLIVATFDTVSEGMQLYAFDRWTGKLLWRGDVQQFAYPHSVYLHDVVLDVRGERVVLDSVEAAGCTKQIYQPSTGRRLEVVTVDQWAKHN